MPAVIFGDRFLGRREPAWHGLGKTFDTPMTMTEAVVKANIDFRIAKHPVVASIDTPEGTELIPTNDFAVVREPVDDDDQYRVLSIVGKQWTPIQASTLATMLDPITEQFPVETIGALGYGEKIFMTLNAGEAEICGEDHELYYLVTDHRDGGGALSIAFTPVRVVCQNTLTAGLSQSKVNVRLRHTRTIEADAEWYVGIFNQLAVAKDKAIEEMDTLSTVRINEKEMERVITSAYPDASKPQRLTLSKDLTPDNVPASIWSTLLKDKQKQVEEFEKRQARVDRIRDGARERYAVFNDEFPNLAETPWAIWQAVCETEDYRRGHKDSGTAVFGTRADAKARAFTTARKLVTG